MSSQRGADTRESRPWRRKKMLGLPRSALDYSSGMSLGDCTFFGRKAGLHAAEGAKANA